MPDSTVTSVPSAPAPKKRGPLGFLFRTTLGCIAFAFGSLVVLILLLPTMLSGFVARTAVGAFDEQYLGRLEIASVDLAWFQPQTVHGLVLRDPDGAQVARAELTAPSLWSLLTRGDGRYGTIAAEAEADFVADDAGLTNLQRALARRTPRVESEVGDPGSQTSLDLALVIEQLDVDVRVNAKRLTWSDAQTRALGRPFELRDVVATVVAKPGQPIVAHVGGEIRGEQPGVLEVDAAVHGPIDFSQSWPLGRTEAKGRVEGFSTAMVDGLANLRGNLVEVLGPTFALRFDVSAASADAGQADVTIDGERGDLALHVRLENGELIALEKPFLVANVPYPKGILERLVRENLPADARLTLADAGKPWIVRVTRLRIPLPDPNARDMAALRPALEKAEIDVDVDLPGSAAFETDALRKAGFSAGLSAIRLTAQVKPGQPLVARLDAALDAGAPGKVTVDVKSPGFFAAMAEKRVPAIDLDANVEGLSTLALGEIAGQGERIAGALGPVAQLSLTARGASLDGGDLRVVLKSERLDADVGARIASGQLTVATPTRLTWTPSAEFLQQELAGKLPEGAQLAVDGPVTLQIAELSALIRDAKTGAFAGTDALVAGLAARGTLTLPAATFSRASAGSPPVNFALRAGVVVFDVAAGAPPHAQLGADVVLDSVARLEAEVTFRESLAALMKSETKPSLTATVALRGLDTAALERLTAQAGQLAPLLGPKLQLMATVEGRLPESGTVDVAVVGSLGRTTLKGRLDAGRFVAQGQEGIDATLPVTAEFLRARIGDSLPAGTRIEVVTAGEPIRVQVRDIVLPLEAKDLAERLSGTSLKLTASLPALAYADTKTDAAKQRVVVEKGQLEASLVPGEKPFVKLHAQVVDAKPGSVAIDVAALKPLAVLSQEGAWKTFPVSLKVRVENMPTAIVDVIAKQDGLLLEALGPTMLADVDAPDLSFDRGGFKATMSSEKQMVSVEGRLEGGNLIIEKREGLDASLALGPLVTDRILGRLLPFFHGAKLSALSEQVGQSVAFKPFKIESDSLSVPIEGDISKLNAVLKVDLGTFSWDLPPVLNDLKFLQDVGEFRLPSFTVPIQDGVARYDRLPIQLGSKQMVVSGSVHLVDGEMQLTTELPLALLGKSFDRELAQIRQFVPLDTVIPIELRGTWNKPRIGFPDGYLKKLLEGAAGKAAEKGLGDLLDGLLGGGKKKKDG